MGSEGSCRAVIDIRFGATRAFLLDTQTWICTLHGRVLWEGGEHSQKENGILLSTVSISHAPIAVRGENWSLVEWTKNTKMNAANVKSVTQTFLDMFL